MTKTLLERLTSPRIIPVVTLDDARQAAPVAQALAAGGLACIEITFRTEAAAESIEAIAALENILVGAGTVLDVTQAQQAVSAGARYLVSPGLNEKVVEYAQQNEIPLFAGIATPTEATQAVHLGLEVVKFFPAEALGGLSMLKALSAPFGRLRFIPTGGINLQNLPQYLAHPKVAACGGSWLTPKHLLQSGDYAGIRDLAIAAVKAAAG